MNGTDLKIRRIAAHVKAKDLAEAAGWPAYKVSRVETRVFVEPADVETYVAALATCASKTTEGASAA